MTAQSSLQVAHAIGLHCRENGEAYKAVQPRGNEILRAAHRGDTHATLVFLVKYGRDGVDKGSVRTVLLTDDGNEYNLTMETVSPPTTKSRDELARVEGERADSDRSEALRHELRIAIGDTARYSAQMRSLQTALAEATEAHALARDHRDALVRELDALDKR